MPDGQIAIPPGLVAVTTYGSIASDTVQCLMDTRSLSEREGLNNITWRIENGALVDRARNSCARQVLHSPAQWLLMIDADMTWEPDLVKRMLLTAYASHPHFDVVGAYCCLRGDLALPTIDTGTGTWESHYPNSGVMDVIRTGGACLLVKRHVFERMPDPWFATRIPARPVDFMAEVDNWARMKFDGKNPFRDQPNQAWERLTQCAMEDPAANPAQFTPAEVGEDSGFCDKVKLAGFRIGVDTSIQCGHLEKRVTNWTHHKEAVEKQEKQNRLCSGMLA